MKKWRPEGWEESLDATVRICAIDERFKAASSEVVMKGLFEAGADVMLGKVCEEIEKVENPENPLSLPDSYDAFNECRQKILTLLRSEKKED